VLPATNERVEQNTPRKTNEEIRERTAANVARYAGATPGQIDRRLKELNQEWDIERTLEANAATLAFAGAILALTVNRKFAWVSALVSGFLLQHALQGWCPPVPMFRKLGVRTTREIDEEKTALRIVRADFRPTPDPADALRQARRQ
jgi:hypothetical protein